tara:strand:- start:361 stop:621 length:261 start_codon:yes stop_codon:yes gene_type:complete
MEMDMRIDHHEHEVVDLLRRDEAPQRLFDVAGDGLKLPEGCFRKVGEMFVLAVGEKDHCAKRHLFRARKHAPVLIVGDQCLWPAKL